MARTIHELAAVVTTNVQQFEAGMQRAAQATLRMAKAWDDSRDQIRDAVVAIDTAVSRVGTAIGTAMVAASGYLAKLGVQAQAAQQQTLISLETMLGDAAKAQQFFADLQKRAIDTPFELKGLTTVTKQLLASGVASEKVLPMMDNIVETVSAIGGNQETLEGVGRAFSQMLAKGTVSAEEMQQLAERGVPAWKILAQVIGTDVPGAMKLAEERAISADTAVAGMLDLLGQKFAGAAQRQSTTLDGLMSSARDLVARGAQTVFEPLATALGGVLTQAVAVLQSSQFTATLQSLSAQVQQFINQSGLLALTQPQWWQGLLVSLQASQGHIAAFGAAAIQVVPILTQMAQAIAAMLTPVAQLAASYPQVVAWLAAWKVASLLGVSQALMAIGAALPGVANLLVSGTAALAGWGQAAVAAISGAGGIVPALAALGTLVASTLGQLTALGASMLGLAAGPFAVIAAGVATLVAGVTALAAAYRELGAAQQRAGELESKRMAQTDGRHQRELTAIADKPRAEQRDYLSSELAGATRNAAGLQGRVEAAQSEVARLATKWGETKEAVGLNPLLGEARRELVEVEQQALAALRRVEQLQAARAALDATPDPVSDADLPPSPSPYVAPDYSASRSLLGGLRDKQGSGTKPGMADELQNALGLQYESATVMAEVIQRMTGLGTEAAERYAYSATILQGMPEEMSKLVSDIAIEATANGNRAERSQFLQQPTDQFRNALQAQEGNLPQAQLEGFARQFGQARQQVMGGQMSQEQFGDQSGRLTMALQQAEAMQNTFARLGESMPTAMVEQFRTQFDSIANAFTTGQSTAGQFEAQMRTLNNAVQAGAEAAQETAAAEMQAMKLRLIQGKGTKDDQTKLKELQGQDAEKKFGSQVDETFNKMFGLGDAAQKAATGLQKVETGAEGAANGLGRGRSGGLFGGVDLAALMQTTQQFLSTLDGQRFNLQATIGQLTANLQILATVPGSMEKQINLLAEIRDLEAALTRLPPNPFDAVNVDPLFRDPGLQETRQDITVNASFPNFTRIGAAEARQLWDTVTQEAERLGNAAFR